MAWWIVVLLPVPVVAVLAFVAVIATAFSISAEEDRRRLRLKRLVHHVDVTTERSEPASFEVVRETPAQAVVDPVERVSTVH